MASPNIEKLYDKLDDEKKKEVEAALSLLMSHPTANDANMILNISNVLVLLEPELKRPFLAKQLNLNYQTILGELIEFSEARVKSIEINDDIKKRAGMSSPLPPISSTAAPAAPAVPAVPPAAAVPPPSKTPSPDDIKNFKKSIQMLEEAMPGLSEVKRDALTKEIEKRKALLSHMGDSTVTRDKLKKFPEVIKEKHGIQVGSDTYTNYIKQIEENSPKWQSAYRAYELENKRYEDTLSKIRDEENKLDDLEASLSSKPSSTPLASPDIEKTKKYIEEQRLRLETERAHAGSMLVALTKSYGGYSKPSDTKVRLYRGGNLGFDTRVLSRAAATQQGLLNPHADPTTVEIPTSYAANVHLDSNEVVVSKKSYKNYECVLVQEPGLVRDQSPPATEKITEGQLNEKAMQMAIMFAFAYEPGKPVVIRGGDPALRQKIHAALLVLKYAAQEGTLQTMSNWFSGKNVSELHLQDMNIGSDVGPEQSGSGLMGRMQSQKTRDMAFVKGVFPELESSKFLQQKEEIFEIREAYRKQDKTTPHEVFFSGPKPKK